MKRCLITGAIIFVIAICLGIGVNYSHEETNDVTIRNITEQQHVSGSTGENGGSVSTTYTYIVSTDKGVYSIKPSGIYASREFGNLNIGERYHIKTRGYSFQLLGMYPYIIEATPI